MKFFVLVFPSGIAISDLTLSFVESHYPQELIKHLTQQRNFTVEENHPGIYNVKGDIMPIQLIDSRKLSAEENLWQRGRHSSVYRRDNAGKLEERRGDVCNE